MTLADYVISILAERGVRQVYGYPGAAIIPLMAAIDRHPDLQWILVRNESAAALAAAAEARLTGNLAVFLVTSGPGATNVVTGLVDAHVDRTPVLAITGLVPTWKQSRSGFQDLDQARLLSTLIPRSVSCQHPDQLPVLLRDCIGQAEQHRDVVHLAIPHDIQVVPIRPEDPRFAPGRIPQRVTAQVPPPAALDLVASELAQVARMVVVVGPRAVGAGEAIEELAERLDAPIISTLDAKGIIDESHPSALGVLGIFGAPGVEMARSVLQRSEAVLAFGIDNVAPFLTDQSGVQVRDLYLCEPDFTSLSHQYVRRRTLVGPLATIAQELYARLQDRRQDDLTRELLQQKRTFLETYSREGGPGGEFVHPVRFLSHLNSWLEADSVVALDVGDNTVWSAQYLLFTKRQRILVSNQLGTMGFCLPAAIAAKLARPGARVVGLCGDGGFQMLMGEMLTAVQYGLHFVLVVFNNGVLQRVIAQQGEPVGTVIRNPDFVALAKACGADGAVVRGDTDIREVLDRAFRPAGAPFLIDLRLDPKLKAPMSQWEDGFVPMHFG